MGSGVGVGGVRAGVYTYMLECASCECSFIDCLFLILGSATLNLSQSQALRWINSLLNWAACMSLTKVSPPPHTTHIPHTHTHMYTHTHTHTHTHTAADHVFRYVKDNHDFHREFQDKVLSDEEVVVLIKYYIPI